MTTEQNLLERIVQLAAVLDIQIAHVGDASPAYDTPDAVLFEFTQNIYKDHFALQDDVTILGPYEYGCDWGRVNPAMSYPEGWKAWREAGMPKRTRLAIPRRDLQILIECLRAAIAERAGIWPDLWDCDFTRCGLRWHGRIAYIGDAGRGRQVVRELTGWRRRPLAERMLCIAWVNEMFGRWTEIHDAAVKQLEQAGAPFEDGPYSWLIDVGSDQEGWELLRPTEVTAWLAAREVTTS